MSDMAQKRRRFSREFKSDIVHLVAGSLTTAEKSELAALRREVRALKRDRDFFAQATAYFAQAKR